MIFSCVSLDEYEILTLAGRIFIGRERRFSTYVESLLLLIDSIYWPTNRNPSLHYGECHPGITYIGVHLHRFVSHQIHLVHDGRAHSTF